MHSQPNEEEETNNRTNQGENDKNPANPTGSQTTAADSGSSTHGNQLC